MWATQQLEQQLERLQTQSAEREVIDVRLPGGRLYCPVAMVDRIGCAIHQLSWEVDQGHRDIARIRQVSEQLASQIRYLLEPLALIEIDTEQLEAQVRSAKPHRDRQGSSYYELLVSPRGLRLQRYSAPRGSARQPIPMQLTHEVLRRLIEDFATAAL